MESSRVEQTCLHFLMFLKIGNWILGSIVSKIHANAIYFSNSRPK